MTTSSSCRSILPVFWQAAENSARPGPAEGRGFNQREDASLIARDEIVARQATKGVRGRQTNRAANRNLEIDVVMKNTLAGVMLALVLAVGQGWAADPVLPMQKPVTLQFESIDVFVVLAQLSDQVGLKLIHDHLGKTPCVTVNVYNQAAASVVDDITTRTHMRWLVAGRALVVGEIKMIQQYRDVTTFTYTYQKLSADEAVRIVQGVYPYVDYRVKASTVKYTVPKSFLPLVTDLARSVDK